MALLFLAATPAWRIGNLVSKSFESVLVNNFMKNGKRNNVIKKQQIQSERKQRMNRLSQSSRYLLVLVGVIMIVATAVGAEKIESVIQSINNGTKVNEKVTVVGSVDKWYHQPGQETYAYGLTDDWGDVITIITVKDPPKKGERYKVTGIVFLDAPSRQYMLTESDRESLSSFDWMLYALIGGIVLVGGTMTIVLVRGRRSEHNEFADFPVGSVVSLIDKTKKITAASADERAIQDGTIKVLPGRFEVEGGSAIKEIPLIRQRGVRDDQVEYTFGRTAGDKITHIQIADSTVSSKQARLKYRNGSFTLINIPDPGDPDRNATVLNGRSMTADESATLKEGDQLVMGNVKLIFRTA